MVDENVPEGDVLEEIKSKLVNIGRPSSHTRWTIRASCKNDSAANTDCTITRTS